MPTARLLSLVMKLSSCCAQLRWFAKRSRPTTLAKGQVAHGEAPPEFLRRRQAGQASLPHKRVEASTALTSL